LVKTIPTCLQPSKWGHQKDDDDNKQLCSNISDGAEAVCDFNIIATSNWLQLIPGLDDRCHISI